MLTQAQQAVIDYLRNLDRESLAEKIKTIVQPDKSGARINGKEVRRLFEMLGYPDAGITYDFADELAGMYREAV